MSVVGKIWTEIRNGTIKFLLLEEELKDKDVQQKRLDTCHSCEFYIKEKDKCKQCGCYMSIKSGMLKNLNPKTQLVELTHCPEGKWDDEDISEYYKTFKQ